MKSRLTILLTLVASLAVGVTLFPGTSSAAPLVYIQLLARPDGTTQAFSSSITPTSAGEEFDWIVVATLAPAGTTNANLVNINEASNAIGSWQYNASTGVSDGIGATVYALFENPTATTQVNFQNAGFLGATATGGHAGIDPSISNGLTTTLNNAGNFDNASYSGGVQTSTYTYTTQTGVQTPTGITQASTGNALWQNFAAATGENGGVVSQRGASNANNDLTNVLGFAGEPAYVGVDDGTVNASGTNQQPVTVILESGSHDYYNTAMGSAQKVDGTFKVASLGSGSSVVSINAFDTNLGNPGGALALTDQYLNLQYHDPAGNLKRPGTSGSLQYSAQMSSDPVIQYTGLVINGSGPPTNTSVLGFYPPAANFRVMLNSAPTSMNVSLTNAPGNGADTANYTGAASNDGVSGPTSGTAAVGSNSIAIQVQNNANGTGTAGVKNWTYTVTNTSNPNDLTTVLPVSANVVAKRALFSASAANPAAPLSSTNPINVSGSMVGAGTITIPYTFTSTGDFANTTSVQVSEPGITTYATGNAGFAFSTTDGFQFYGGQAAMGSVTYNAANDTYTASGTITGTVYPGQTITGSISLPVNGEGLPGEGTYDPVVVNFTATSTPYSAIADGSNSPTTFGAPVTQTIPVGETFAAVGTLVTGVNGTAGAPVEHTAAVILAGDNSSPFPATVSMSWRTRNLNEPHLISDVLNLNLAESFLVSLPPTMTSAYVLQMSFGPSALGDGPAEIQALVNNGFLYLATLPSGGTWENAVLPNLGNDATVAQQGFIGSFADFQASVGDDPNLLDYMGAWGVDPVNDEAWAVLDYDAVFAVVPEPSTWALLAVGGLALGGLAISKRRARRAAAAAA